MSYTPPAGDALHFVLTDPGYTPPAGDAIHFALPKVLGWQDILALVDVYSRAAVGPLTDTFRLADSFRGRPVVGFEDQLLLRSTWLDKLIQTKQALTDGLLLGDRLGLQVREVLSDTLVLTDSAPIARVILALHDALYLADSVAVRVNLQLTLSDVFRLTDQYGVNIRLRWADVLHLSDSWANLTRTLLALTDSLHLQDSWSLQFSVVASFSDTVRLQDSLGWSVQKVLALADSFLLVGRLQVGADEYLAWAVNTQTGGAYKFSNYPFNSFARVGGKNLMCAADGIYEVAGEDDNGAVIQGMLKTGRLSLENLQAGFPGDTLKELLAAYLLFDAEGETVLKLTISRRDVTEEHWYTLKESAQMAKQQLPISNSLRSVLWQFEISKLDGKPAAFREIEVIPLYLTRRV